MLNSANNVEKIPAKNFDSNLPPTPILPPIQDSADYTSNTLFTVDFIRKYLLGKRKKTPGYDCISAQLLYELPYDLLGKIADIFNNKWADVRFPKEWGITLIIPILKPNRDPHSIESYIPIALLTTLLKCFNSKIKELMTEHIINNCLLPATYYGFCKGKGVNDVFFDLINEVYEKRRLKKQIALISIDFSKAFDTVNCTKLISILQEKKFSTKSITWITQFLFNRQILMKNDHGYGEVSTSKGLPQGSCLSPLLFNIYTTEFHSINEELVKVYQYADDYICDIRKH